jgi:hypothetical protein
MGVGAVAAHDLPAVVELDGLGAPGAGDVEDDGPAARVAQKAGLAVGDAIGADPDVLAGDQAAVVDVEGELPHASGLTPRWCGSDPVRHEPGNCERAPAAPRTATAPPSGGSEALAAAVAVSAVSTTAPATASAADAGCSFQVSVSSLSSLPIRR